MRNRGCGGDHAHAFGRRQAGALLQVQSKSKERHVVHHPRQRASVQRAVLTVSGGDRHTLRPAVALRIAGDSDATEKSTLVRHSGIVSGSAASDNAATIAQRCFRCSSDLLRRHCDTRRGQGLFGPTDSTLKSLCVSERVAQLLSAVHFCATVDFIALGRRCTAMASSSSSGSKYSNSSAPALSFRKREFASTAEDADELDAVAAVDASEDDERKKKSRVDAASLGDRLVDLVRQACVETNTPFKRDPMTWGVTRDDDPRMTPRRFGDYKSPQRVETEAKLREYMSAPSESRQTGLRDFSIAVTVAAPGTGKTRLLDDALRMPLDTTHFAHVLRLAITFDDWTNGAFEHPIATRVLREFFCGPADIVADDVLKKIDKQLSRLFPSDDVNTVARSVLDALEALYFQQRGGALGRSVLLIDEISKARLLMADKDKLCENLMYRTVVSWVDAAKGRRGAVLTGLTVVSPWAEVTLPLMWLPLGTFDVWDAAVQGAIEHEARSMLTSFSTIDRRLWPLLAATGGRPRDIFLVLERLKKWRTYLTNAEDMALMTALRADDVDMIFSRYLLPSMLGVEFDTFVSGRLTQFGNDAASSALLNADLLATKLPNVPAVSFRYSRSFPASANHLLNIFAALKATVFFCELDGSGKDFKRAWVLLTYSLLQLQHTARKDEAFWPTLGAGAVDLGGPARPTAREIDVFTVNASTRIEALFARPDEDRVFEAPGSTIRRKVPVDETPTLALWKNAWTATVAPGAAEDMPSGWPMTLDVEWRPWTVVYFSDVVNAAIDFMLLVGEAGGTGDKEPHIYVFQNRALRTANVAQKMVAGIARRLKKQLNVLFGESHASTHVLRLAGIQSARQVTLCIAALNYGKVDLKALGAPFNVVLFDSADFRGLGGAAFRDTSFFRSMAAAKK
jgi:hypothetical protein